MTYSESEQPTIISTNGGNGMWGGDGWWAIIVLLALFGGYGFGGNGGGVQNGYVLASDFANIERKIDGVNNGLCDGFYAMNTTLLNGFSGINSNMSNYAFGLQSQLCNSTRDIIENSNANYRAIHDELVSKELREKDQKIAELELRASQQAQNNYIISQLRPSPTPAYVVPNPYCNCGNFNTIVQ